MTENVNPVIAQFMKDQAKFAEDFEKSQPDSGTQTRVSDVKDHFEKNQNLVKMSGGKNYEIKKFTTTEWLFATPVLGVTFAPSMALMWSGQEDGTGMAEGLMQLFTALGGQKMLEIVKILLSGVTLNGKPVEVDDVDPEDLAELCLKVVKLNYDAVFTKGIQQISEMMATLTIANKSL